MYGDDGDDFLLSLARSLTERVDSDEQSLEGLFARTRRTEMEIETALSPEDVAPEDLPEPQPAVTLARPAPDRAPSVLVPDVTALPLVAADEEGGSSAGRVPVLLNGNGHQAEELDAIEAMTEEVPTQPEQLRLF